MRSVIRKGNFLTQTAAERAIDYIKRAGSSTPRELEDMLGLAQKDQYAYFRHAIEVGALVKHKDALGRVAYCLGPSVDVFNPLRTRKEKPQRPAEHVGKQIEAKNSGAHALPIAAQCDGAPQTQPEVVNNPGSLGGASSRITPRQDEAVAVAQPSETPPATLQPVDLAPGAAKSGAGDDTQAGEAIVAKTVAMAITDDGKASITVNDEHVFVLDPGLARKVGAFFGKTEGIWRG